MIRFQLERIDGHKTRMRNMGAIFWQHMVYMAMRAWSAFEANPL
jgi:hypothetical protein